MKMNEASMRSYVPTTLIKNVVLQADALSERCLNLTDTGANILTLNHDSFFISLLTSTKDFKITSGFNEADGDDLATLSGAVFSEVFKRFCYCVPFASIAALGDEPLHRMDICCDYSSTNSTYVVENQVMAFNASGELGFMPL